MTKPLPDSPNWEQLQKQAKELLKAVQSQDSSAVNRFKEFHPEYSSNSPAEILSAPHALADAQLTLAREYGYGSWPKLKAYIKSIPLHGKLKSAIDANDFAQVMQLLKSTPELISAPIGYGKQGPLTWAAECRGVATPPSEARLEIARFLIDASADIHERGDGPLMRAALNGGRIPMMELLVSRGADVNALWQGNYPILFAPCESVQPASIKWLLDHGADPNIQGNYDSVSSRPLDFVLGSYGRTPKLKECIELLIQAGGTGACGDFASMPIHRGRLDLLELAIDADPELVHRRFLEFNYGTTGARNLTLTGCTLLHVAAEFGELDAAKLLVERGADVNATSLVDADGVGGQTPIFHAVTQYDEYALETARYLIEQGADLSVRAKIASAYDLPGETVFVTPLGYAVRFPAAHWETGKTHEFLLGFNAPAGDVYAAAKLGLVDELKALLQAGGDPNSTDPYGETAIVVAGKRGHEEIVELLRKAAASG